VNEQVGTYIHKYPDEIAALFTELRQLIYDSVSADLVETLWAKLPSYYAGECFVRLIPFKDHINIEAQAAIKHKEALTGYKFTPKGMVQIYTKQSVPADALRQVFAETLSP